MLGLIPGDRHTVSATIGIAVTPMSAEGSVDAARSPLSAMMEASAGLDAATNRWQIISGAAHHTPLCLLSYRSPPDSFGSRDHKADDGEHDQYVWAGSALPRRVAFLGHVLGDR